MQNFGDQPVSVDVEVDVHGHGRFARTTSLAVGPGQLTTHVFPTGFSAHWARVVPDSDTTASAQFIYT